LRRSLDFSTSKKPRAAAVDGVGAVASIALGNDAAGQVCQIAETAALERC
jgi:hypothetical protein